MVPPLQGIRVVELARILAGPWCGQMLADLGAEVIKVESPEGDDTRRWGPPFIDRGEDHTAAYFHACNRGKQSVTADFSTPEGQALVRGLVEGADILIENFKLGGLTRFGLDWESLRKVNPRLIYCSITGFGQDGPYAHRPGYDYIMQGMTGLMSITGEPGGQPQRFGVAVVDVVTGLYAASAVLAALHRREATGAGGQVELSLFDAGIALTANQAMNYLASGVPPQRQGNQHPNLVPYQVFECADGHIIIATGNDAQYRRLCAALELAPLASDPRFASNADRIARRDTLVTLLGEATRLRRKADLLAACEAQGIPVGPINDLGEVFADPHAIARGTLMDLDGVPSVRPPFRFDGESCTATRASPRLDEHGAAIRERLAIPG